MLTNHYVQCTCGSTEHLVVFQKFDKNIDPSDEDAFYISVQLRQWRPFWKRFLCAIKYIFGYQSRYGHWDCVSVSREEAENLRKFLYED